MLYIVELSFFYWVSWFLPKTFFLHSLDHMANFLGMGFCWTKVAVIRKMKLVKRSRGRDLRLGFTLIQINHNNLGTHFIFIMWETWMQFKKIILTTWLIFICRIFGQIPVFFRQIPLFYSASFCLFYDSMINK